MPWKDAELIACISKVTKRLDISATVSNKLDLTPKLFEDILTKLGATPRLPAACDDSPEHRYRAVIITIERRLAVPLSHISPRSLADFDNENLGNLIEILDVLVNHLNLTALPSLEELANAKQAEPSESTPTPNDVQVNEFPAIENVNEDIFLTPRRKCLRALLSECMRTKSKERFRPALKVKHVQIAPPLYQHRCSHSPDNVNDRDQSLLKPQYRPLIRPPKFINEASKDFDEDVRENDNQNKFLYERMLAKFPHLKLDEHMIRKIRAQSMEDQLRQLKETQSPRDNMLLKRDRNEMETRLKRQLKILKDEVSLQRRLDQLRERQDTENKIKTTFSARKEQKIQAKNLYKDYVIEFRAKNLAKEAQEEILFRRAYEQANKMEKERIREAKKWVSDVRKKQRELRNLKSLAAEKCLLDQIRDDYSMKVDQEETARRRRDWSLDNKKKINQLKSEIKEDIKAIQSCILDKNDGLHFRELDLLAS